MLWMTRFGNKEIDMMMKSDTERLEIYMHQPEAGHFGQGKGTLGFSLYIDLLPFPFSSSSL
jgi:hypothetical protein